MRSSDGSRAQTYFLYDGLGSTRQLTDNSGDVVATYEYDVFGALRAQTGPADTGFRYTGEQWDSESGFYYLRARYHDPAIGRFVSRDPVLSVAHSGKECAGGDKGACVSAGVGAASGPLGFYPGGAGIGLIFEWLPVVTDVGVSTWDALIGQGEPPKE